MFAAAARPVNWRRNLVALWITNFTGILGVTAMIPFVAFFLARDLGVHRPSELALWTGGRPRRRGSARRSPVLCGVRSETVSGESRCSYERS